jgi:imidazolonepropionase-like amidohydrolase
MTSEWNIPKTHAGTEWVAGLTAVPGLDPSTESVTDPNQQVLFNNVNIFDGLNDGLKLRQNVLVQGNKIKTISDAPIQVGPEATVIDGGGRTLMPGLIDCHVHLTIAENFGTIESDFTYGDLHLNAAVAARHMFLDGFTSARDVGGPAFPLKRAVDAGKFLGPRIYPSGAFISQTSGHGDFRARNDPNPSLCNCSNAANFVRFGIGVSVDGRPNVLAATRQNLMQGAAQIKIMAGGGGSSKYDPIDVTQFTEDEMKAAVDAADDWGTYVCAHIFTDKAIRRFVKAGGKSIEHGFFMSEDVVEMIAEKGLYVVPQMWGVSPELFNNPLVPVEKHAAIHAMHEKYKMFAPWLLKYGVNVAFASDLVGPVLDGIKARRYEMYWRTQAFGSNFEVLKQLTSTAGKLLSEAGPRDPYPGVKGVIEEGALADILVVDGNPLKDFSVLGANERWYTETRPPQPNHNLQIIMKDGQIYKNTIQ